MSKSQDNRYKIIPRNDSIESYNDSDSSDDRAQLLHDITVAKKVQPNSAEMNQSINIQSCASSYTDEAHKAEAGTSTYSQNQEVGSRNSSQFKEEGTKRKNERNQNGKKARQNFFYHQPTAVNNKDEETRKTTSDNKNFAPPPKRVYSLKQQSSQNPRQLSQTDHNLIPQRVQQSQDEIFVPSQKEKLFAIQNDNNKEENYKRNNSGQHISHKEKQKREKHTKSDIYHLLRIKKREIKLLKRLQEQGKLSISKISQSSYPSDYLNSSEDEMEREKPSCKEVMFSKRARKWAFWFIVAFLAALTVKDVISLVLEYTEEPKQSDMNIMFNESMTMPNITFCMSRAQAWSHFRLSPNETAADFDKRVQDQLMNMTDRESFLNSSWDYRTVMDAYNLISALTSMERETTVEGSANTIQKFGKQDRFKALRKTLRTWIDVLNERGVTFEEFMQKTGKETLKRSMQRFQRTSYKDDEIIRTGVRISWISQQQFCFQPQFDADNFKPIEDQGNFFAMALSHNAEKLDNVQVDCMSIDFHGRASSNSRFSGSKGQAKDGFNDELCMGMTHETTVEVKARYKMLPNDEEGTACRDHEDGEDGEFDCHARCRMEFIKSLCNCTAPTLSYLLDDEALQNTPLCDYTQCTINVQTGNYTDDGCTKKCYRDCDQIRFEIDHERKGKSMRPDLTTVYLNWGSFEYLTLEQKWVWSVSSFIAALGGSIGMWLGLSILSLIQGGTYMYKYLTETVIKKKKTRSMSTATDTGPKANSAAVNKDPIAANPFQSPFKSKVGNAKQPPPDYE